MASVQVEIKLDKDLKAALARIDKKIEKVIAVHKKDLKTIKELRKQVRELKKGSE